MHNVIGLIDMTKIGKQSNAIYPTKIDQRSKGMLVLSSPAWQIHEITVLKSVFGQKNPDNLQNGPLSPKMCTGTPYGVITIYSYKVIQLQR